MDRNERLQMALPLRRRKIEPVSTHTVGSAATERPQRHTGLLVSAPNNTKVRTQRLWANRNTCKGQSND
jgi:hypothetical protein